MQRLIVFFLFIILVSGSYSQDKKSFKMLFQEAEYFFYRGDFREASHIYSELLKESPGNANLQFLIGACYLSLQGEKSKSIPYLESAVNSISAGYREGSYKEQDAPRESLFALARAYHITNQFEKALEYYHKYRNVMKMSDPAEIDFILKHVESCRLAEKMIARPVPLKREELPQVINSFKTCYNPVLGSRDSILLFMADKPFYNAIMMSRIQEGVWQDPLVINDQLEADEHCNICSISGDGRELFLSKKEEDGGYNLYTSSFRRGKWTKMKPLGAEINTEYDETHAVCTPDGKSLYFTSNRPHGEGAMDIYKAVKDGDGEWSNPVSLGKPVNTIYSEETPFFSEDGKLLFFSSMGHATMGGFDVFYSSLLPTGAWSFPSNMGYPVSTSDDDLFFYPLGNGSSALYSGSMDRGEGVQQVCFVELDTAKTRKNFAVKGKILLDDNIRDLDESFTVDLIDPSRQSRVKTVVPDSRTGEYTLEIPRGSFQIVMKGEGYSDKKEDISIISGISREEIEVKSTLIPEEVASGKVLIKKNVLFSFDSDKLDSTACHEVEKLFKIMQLHPEIYVQITGHSDALGSDAYNLDLSSRRAGRIVNYLTAKGIARERFLSIGAGEKRIVAININPDGTDNPVGRRYNRYAEIRLINNSNQNIRVEETFIPEHLKPRVEKRYLLLLKEPSADSINIPAKISGEPVKMIKTDRGKLFYLGEYPSKESTLHLLNDVIDKDFPDARILPVAGLDELLMYYRVSENNNKGPFTIQIMALKKPVDLSWFKPVGGEVTQYISGDGLNRYTTGFYLNKDSAQIVLERLISKGYSDAFITGIEQFTRFPSLPDEPGAQADQYFTVQLSTTRIPPGKKALRGISDINVRYDKDGNYNLNSGLFPSRHLAEIEMTRLRSIGFTDACIKQISE